MALVYGGFVISGFIYRGALTFIPAHIEKEVSIGFFGWEAAAVAGVLGTLALLGGAFGWYAGGIASERWRREYFMLAMTPLVALLLLSIGFTSDLGLLVALALFVIINSTLQPAFVTLVAEYSPSGRLGVSYGVSFFLSFGLGSFAATFAGFFADRWGIEAVSYARRRRSGRDLAGADPGCSGAPHGQARGRRGWSVIRRVDAGAQG